MRGQGLSLDVGHDDIGLSFVLADIVDWADMGVANTGGGARFTLETLHAKDKPVGRAIEAWQLQGNDPVQLRVLSFVDRAHAAGAEPPQDAVATNLGGNGASR